MENWKSYSKMCISNKYTVDKVVYTTNKELQIKLKDTSINIEKEPDIVLLFKNVYAHKYSDEHGMLETFSNIEIEEIQKNSIMIKEKKVKTKRYNHFMINDKVDTIIEVLTKEEPSLNGKKITGPITY